MWRHFFQITSIVFTAHVRYLMPNVLMRAAIFLPILVPVARCDANNLCACLFSLAAVIAQQRHASCRRCVPAKLVGCFGRFRLPETIPGSSCQVDATPELSLKTCFTIYISSSNAVACVSST